MVWHRLQKEACLVHEKVAPGGKIVCYFFTQPQDARGGGIKYVLFVQAFPVPILSPSIDFIKFHFVLATLEGDPLLLWPRL